MGLSQEATPMKRILTVLMVPSSGSESDIYLERKKKKLSSPIGEIIKVTPRS